jgi:hypothetical protein
MVVLADGMVHLVFGDWTRPEVRLTSPKGMSESTFALSAPLYLLLQVFDPHGHHPSVSPWEPVRSIL